MRTRSRRFSTADVILAWTVAIIWMAIIFVLSSQPGGIDSGSGRLRFGWEKLAHFMVFGLLGLLVANALTTGGMRSRRFWWTFVVCAIFAVSDELHQTLVPGRTPTVLDIFIDMSGSVIGYAGFMILSASTFARRAVARRRRPKGRRASRAVHLAQLRREP